VRLVGGVCSWGQPFASSDYPADMPSSISYPPIPQDDAIRNLFSSKTKREYTVSSLVVFVSAFYFLATITYGISCPTGLFVPSILCGAAYGERASLSWGSVQLLACHHLVSGRYRVRKLPLFRWPFGERSFVCTQQAK
jgi:hypothetical protein